MLWYTTSTPRTVSRTQIGVGHGQMGVEPPVHTAIPVAAFAPVTDGRAAPCPSLRGPPPQRQGDVPRRKSLRALVRGPCGSLPGTMWSRFCAGPCWVVTTHNGAPSDLDQARAWLSLTGPLPCCCSGAACRRASVRWRLPAHCELDLGVKRPVHVPAHCVGRARQLGCPARVRRVLGRRQAARRRRVGPSMRVAARVWGSWRAPRRRRS